MEARTEYYKTLTELSHTIGNFAEKFTYMNPVEIIQQSTDLARTFLNGVIIKDCGIQNYFDEDIKQIIKNDIEEAKKIFSEDLINELKTEKIKYALDIVKLTNDARVREYCNKIIELNEK